MCKTLRKLTACWVLFVFSFSAATPSISFAQNLPAGPGPTGALILPNPGTMIAPTADFVPPLLKGMRVDTSAPFQFDFILDSGNAHLSPQETRDEADRLIKYFLASLTIPEDDLWVNLSPYEKDRMIPDEFGLTEMGRDLLAQDYVLKQLTASLIYPERDLGKEFWDRVHTRARALYGSESVPVNTFNKVWILPDKAVVYQNHDTVFVLESRLKVMLEEDYLALNTHLDSGTMGADQRPEQDAAALNTVSSQIIKDVIIPEIEREVNNGQHFARLRQVYHSLILAKWYKENLKASILNREYSNQKKVAGVDVEDPSIKEKIYEQYLEAFKQGVFNYIKEEYDAATQEVIPRQYFSGGLALHVPLETKSGLLTPKDLAKADAVGKLKSITGTYGRARVSPRFVDEYISRQFAEGTVKAGRAIALNDGKSAKVYLVPGLLKATGQFGHIGLGEKERIGDDVVYRPDQRPVVYLDAAYADNDLLRANERFKVQKWEKRKRILGRRKYGFEHPLNALEMRQWIKDNREEAARLLREWDSQAPSLKPLFARAQADGLLPTSEQIAATYIQPEDFQDLNLAAGMTVAQQVPLKAKSGLLTPEQLAKTDVVGKPNGTNGTYVQPTKMKKNGVRGLMWFEELSGLELADVRKRIFGENLETWLSLHRGNGGVAIREKAALQMLQDPEFINRIKTITRDDAPLEIIRFAIRKNIYLGTKSFKLFLGALKQKADKGIKKHIPAFSMPINSFVQLISNLGMIQNYLDRELLEKPANDRLASLVETIRALGLPLDSDNLSQIYEALPSRLSDKVMKSDIQKVLLPKAVYDQLQAAIADERVQRYLDHELLKKPANERLAILVERIRALRLPLDSNNLAHIYSGLPYQLSAKVTKDDIHLIQLPKAAYDQLQAAITDERVQRYLDHELLKKPANERLANLVETIRVLGLPLDSDHLRHIYSGLPYRLSAEVTKDDIQVIHLTKAAYDQLQAAITDERVQGYLDGELLKKPESERLAALIEKIRALGLKLDSDHLGHIYSGLPYRLSAKVTKDDIHVIDLSKAVYDQLQAAISDDRMQRYLDHELLKKPANARLARLVETIRALGLPLDSDNLGQIHSGLPDQLSAKVTKDDIYVIDLSEAIYDQLQAAITDERMQRYLDHEFLDNPANARLARLVETIRALGLPLDSDSLEQIHSGLPYRLSTEVTKDDIPFIQLPKAKLHVPLPDAGLLTSKDLAEVNAVGVEQAEQAMGLENEKRAVGKTGVHGLMWFEGLSGLELADVRKKIFGENLEGWLSLHSRNGGASIRDQAALQMLQDPKFVNRIKTIAKDDVPLEIIRFAMRKNIYLGTKSFGLFLNAFKQRADKGIKEYIPTFSMPINSYVQLISNLGIIQNNLDDELLKKPANERLVEVSEIIQALGLPLDSDNPRQIYHALPYRLSTKVTKDDIQLMQLPKVVYDQLQAAISDDRMQTYLNQEFLDNPANERLARLFERIRALGLPLDSDHLGHIHSGLPYRLSAKVTKDDIQKIVLTKAVYDQLQAAIADERMQTYLNQKFLDNPANERLARLFERIRALGLPLDSDHLGHIHSGLPYRLSAKVTKDDIPVIHLTKTAYDQLQTAIADERMQTYLNQKFLDNPANERLARLVEEIRALGLPLESDNLGHIHSGLPFQLSAKVTKADIQFIKASKAVYDQLQAALADERVQKYLKDYEEQLPRRRLWAEDLLDTLRDLGFRLEINPISFYEALPSNLRKFVFAIKRIYHTDSDGRLVVKIYRSHYRVYNFSQIPLHNEFWANRNVVPLWDDAGDIVAFEVENDGQPLLTINAADVIESGPTAQAVTYYHEQEIWQEIVSHDRDFGDTKQFEDWSHRLEDVIRAYNGSNIPVTEYMDFLISLFALKGVQGIGIDQLLEMAVSESEIELEKAVGFLRYMISPQVRAEGLDVEAILSPQMMAYLQTDQAPLTNGSGLKAAPPGGVDFNLDLLELEMQGQGGNFRLPDLDHNGEQIRIDDGLVPVIINITPITNLPLILGAAVDEEPQLASVQ